jgi:hypothetical protein
MNGDDARRTNLAKHIMAMAIQGERNRKRLVEGALAYAASQSSSLALGRDYCTTIDIEMFQIRSVN